MADLKSLSRQHEDILEVVARIGNHGIPERVKANSFEILLLLSELAGKLSVHLATEDKYLYPKLKGHSDARIRETSSAFEAEMGDLSSVFKAFKAKYSTTGQIGEASAEFLQDFQLIRTALTTRIAKENQRLYPLLEE